jgi:hypothetical protein
MSRGQRGGSPTVVNLSFLDRFMWAYNVNNYAGTVRNLYLALAISFSCP